MISPASFRNSEIQSVKLTSFNSIQFTSIQFTLVYSELIIEGLNIIMYQKISIGDIYRVITEKSLITNHFMRGSLINDKIVRMDG